MEQVKEKIKSVEVPLTLDSIAEVECPHCGCERSVEPDANYTIECEGCGEKYRVVSQI